MEDQMNQYQKYNIEEFVIDDNFRKWVLNPSRESQQRWSQFLKDYPEKERELRKARSIILSLIPVDDDIPNDRLNEVWTRIHQTKQDMKLYRIRSAIKYAAAIIIVTSLSAIAYHQLQNDRFDNSLTQMDSENLGKIILADGSVHYFDEKQNTLTHLNNGKLAINSDTLSIKQEKLNPKDELTHIIVPYGKRIEVNLSDGSHIWLNSGSKFSYPEVFNGNTRDVYLIGEAFLEVAKNPDQPFHVNTPDITVSVTGTRFNVSSYEDDNTVQTVLVEGSVKVQQNKLFGKSVNLLPGEKAVFLRENHQIFKDKANSDANTSWIYGYLMVEKEPVTEILKKLGRYYNQTIHISDGIRGITFSGKLDLKENIEEVLNDLAFASSIQIINQKNHTYYVKP